MPRCLLQCSHYVDRLDWENFAGGGLTNPRSLFGTGSLTSVMSWVSQVKTIVFLIAYFKYYKNLENRNAYIYLIY